MIKKFRILDMSNVPFIREDFKVFEEIAVVSHETPDQEKLKRMIRGYDAYYCSLELQVTREIIDEGIDLKAIVTASTGTDHIDVGYAEEKGIKIISLKNDYDLLKGITSTAELAFGLLLAAVRKIPWSFDAAKAGIWGRDKFRGMQLKGKTFGILGYGRLGEIAAEYAKAFRMKVIACDLRKFESEDVKQVDFETLLRESDIISIHIHLTEENKKLINKRAFSLMKQGVVLVNTSRGAVIDEEAFLEALKSGRVGAAGIDIIEGEWSDDISSHPLIKYSRENQNLVITPHIGGITFEAQKTAYSHAIKKLYEYLLQIKSK